MVSNTQNCKSVLWLFNFLLSGDFHLCFLGHDFGYKLILNQNQRFHRVLERKFMLAHLRQNSTNVKVDISWVQYLQAIVYSLVAVMKVIVFNFQGFFQVVKGWSKLLSSSENTRKIIVGHSSVFVAFFC